ncbi:MAG: hypothetical protein ACKN9X_03050, partial [Candidatus Methylopumilus sp.]
MSIRTTNTDPTYLRTIHDGLLSGTVHKDNASALPIGLVGIYEDALPPAGNVNERKKFLEFFAVWALLKKEASAAFVTPFLQGWSEEDVLDSIQQYSSWFNSPVSGKYTLYHERFRTVLLQMISGHHLKELNEAIISASRSALERRSGDEWELYAVEYLSAHLLETAMESTTGDALKSLAYNDSFQKRQVELSKHFEWSKRLLSDMLMWAYKYSNEEVVECALRKIDLHHHEQNDALSIVQWIAHNEIEVVLQRLDSFGGVDKEGLQRKFKLYILCLLELMHLDTKDKPFRNEALKKVLEQLNATIPVDHNLLNWHVFLPGILMFRLGFALHQLGMDAGILFSRTTTWGASWMKESSPVDDSEIEFLDGVIRIVSIPDWSVSSLQGISAYLQRLNRKDEALPFEKALSRRSETGLHSVGASVETKPRRDKISAPPDVIRELVNITKQQEPKAKDAALGNLINDCLRHGMNETALKIVNQLSSTWMQADSLKRISESLSKKGQFETSFEIVRGIPNTGLRNQ